MSIWWVLIPGFILVESLVLGLIVYNGLVSLRNECDRAWGNIDVLLKQRSDEIPNLVEVCRAYMGHERTTLEAVTAARQAVRAALDPAAAGAAAGPLDEAMVRLFATTEAYPQLKADARFRALQQRITGLENEIADRREFFNNAATNYNLRLERMPDALLATQFHFRRRPLLRFEGREPRARGGRIGAVDPAGAR